MYTMEMSYSHDHIMELSLIYFIPAKVGIKSCRCEKECFDCTCIYNWLHVLHVFEPTLNDIILLITQSHLSVAQASSSFKCLSMNMPMHATPTLITEALHLVTYVQQF